MQHTRVGITPDHCAAPLGSSLRSLPDVGVVTASPADLARMLGTRELDAALLSPLDLARDASMVSIIPGPCVSSRGATGTVTLHFREGLHGIRSMAADPARRAEIVLARILLAEEFGVEPAIVPVQDAPARMLERAEAALLVGDDSQEYSAAHELFEDLVDLWVDLTDLPWVHGVLCARTSDIPAGTARRLAGAVPAGSGEEAFSYTLSEDEQDALSEFFRLAYYHGILPDIPDITVLGADST